MFSSFRYELSDMNSSKYGLEGKQLVDNDKTVIVVLDYRKSIFKLSRTPTVFSSC